MTTANVNSSAFGKLLKVSPGVVVGAQPLYLSSVMIPGRGTLNVLYTIRENDSVYALRPTPAAVMSDTAGALGAVQSLLDARKRP